MESTFLLSIFWSSCCLTLALSGLFFCCCCWFFGFFFFFCNKPLAGMLVYNLLSTLERSLNTSLVPGKIADKGLTQTGSLYSKSTKSSRWGKNCLWRSLLPTWGSQGRVRYFMFVNVMKPGMCWRMFNKELTVLRGRTGRSCLWMWVHRFMINFTDLKNA